MSSEDKFIVFGAPDIRSAEIDEVIATLKSGWIGTGPKVNRFESDFAKYKGIKPNQVLAVNSCTAALHLALISAGVGPGDEVITTATTFCATVNSIIHAQATPVLVDINPNTLNIDPNHIEEKITSKTKAIIPVHMAGLPCDMNSIMSIAKSYDLVVIEDCAHAIESKYKDTEIGTIGDYGCFSFYTTKNVVTAEGGMLIGKESESIKSSRINSLHGMDKDAWKRFSDQGYSHYDIQFPGYKYNMTDINAALGIHQLARIESSWQRRKSIFEYYASSLGGLPIKLPASNTNDCRHAYHLFPIQINQDAPVNRDRFIECLKNKNIGSGVHYVSLAEHNFYIENYKMNQPDFMNSINYGRSTVSLPLSPSLSDADVERIVQATTEVLM